MLKKKTPCRETFEIFPYMEFKFKRLVQARKKKHWLRVSDWRSAVKLKLCESGGLDAEGVNNTFSSAAEIET